MKLVIDTKWLDAISDLDDPLRLALLDGIFAYLEGRDPLLGVEAFRIFCTLKPFIDDDLNRRIIRAERSRENGKKGGRKPKSAKTKSPPNKKKTFDDWLKEPDFQNRSDKLLKLDEWKKKYVPYLYENIRPLKEDEFQALMAKNYTSRQICDTLTQIENRKDLRKRYTHPYRTLLNWLKNNYKNGNS